MVMAADSDHGEGGKAHDHAEHFAACHYWEELADLEDPTSIFRAQGVPAQ